MLHTLPFRYTEAMPRIALALLMLTIFALRSYRAIREAFYFCLVSLVMLCNYSMLTVGYVTADPYRGPRAPVSKIFGVS